MRIPRTYIQQSLFDGTDYKKGDVVDILDRYNVACITFPFKLAPKSSKLIEREWPGEDGKDVYIPKTGLPIDDYDIEVSFCYKGTLDKIKNDMSEFLNFIRGRNEKATGGRLFVYDENVGFGRKDVVVSSIDDSTYQADESDPDAIFSFKVTFHVYDPSTDLKIKRNGTGKIIDLETAE